MHSCTYRFAFGLGMLPNFHRIGGCALEVLPILTVIGVYLMARFGIIGQCDKYLVGNPWRAPIRAIRYTPMTVRMGSTSNANHLSGGICSIPSPKANLYVPGMHRGCCVLTSPALKREGGQVESAAIILPCLNKQIARRNRQEEVQDAAKP